MSHTGNRYAQADDITALGKNLTASELEAVEILIDTACAKLRLTAAKYGKDIDALIADESHGEDYKKVVKSVVIQSVMRAIDSMANTSPALSQGSQSALGYSISMTYFNPGQSLYFLRNELKELGILRQTYGALEVYNVSDDKRNEY